MPNLDPIHASAHPTKRRRRAAPAHPTPVPAPLTAMQEPPRRVIVPGLLDASGEPVMGWALGHSRRPLFMVLGATLGTLAGRRIGGGA